MDVILATYTENPDLICARAMLVCRTQKQYYALMPKRSTIKRLLRTAIESKPPHLSVLEHASFTFHISGISRSCSHQLVRHRIASYSQQSMRAIDFSIGIKNNEHYSPYVVPKTILESDIHTRAKIIYANAMFEALKSYKKLIDAGIPKEDARFVLPIATKTNIIVTMNARELLHFFELRLGEDAQWEIKEMATKMYKLVSSVMPTVFPIKQI